jgi:hypothetical protein
MWGYSIAESMKLTRDEMDKPRGIFHTTRMETKRNET